MSLPYLTGDDLNLLRAFAEPAMVRWDPAALEWTVGHPMFSLSAPLLSRLDALLLDNLIEPVPGDLSVWDVALTDAGRAALKQGATR